MGSPGQAAHSCNAPIITPSVSPAKQQLAARRARPTPHHQHRHPPRQPTPDRSGAPALWHPGMARQAAELGMCAAGQAERGRAPEQSSGTAKGSAPAAGLCKSPWAGRGDGQKGISSVPSMVWHCAITVDPVLGRRQQWGAGSTQPAQGRGQHCPLHCHNAPGCPSGGHKTGHSPGQHPREGGRTAGKEEGCGTCCQPFPCPLFPIKEGNGASPPWPRCARC